MPHTPPDWFRIVNDYSDLADLETGPTVPFIVGAIRNPLGDPPASPSDAQQELFVLLTRMDRDAAVGYGAHIQMCPKLGTLVVKATADGVLTWDPHELEDAVGVDALFGVLWARFGQHILEGKYSKNGDWHPFTESETKTIRIALGD